MRTELEVTQEETQEKSTLPMTSNMRRTERKYAYCLLQHKKWLNIDEEPEMDCGGTRWINGLEWTRQHKQRKQYN